MPNDPSIASIARLRGEFCCAAMEAGFLRHQSADIQSQLRRALLLCSFFYVLFGINDIALLGPERALAPVLARVSMPLLAMLGLRHARRPGASVRAPYHVASAFTLCWMASFLVVTWFRPQEVLLHGMSLAIMAIMFNIFIPNRPLIAPLLACGASVAFLAIAFHQQHETARHLRSMAVLIGFANVFGAVAANRFARLWREQYRAQQVLTSLSMRDPLTGCYNRRHLNDALLDGEMARARRDGLDLSLVLCDLDGFKAINDTHGHHAGDLVLQRFAALLHAMTRDGLDTVVRYGGEEFLVLLPETSPEDAAELAERMRAACAAERIAFGDIELAASASFGVAGANLAAARTLAPQALIAAADELMYEAKRAGRNRVRARRLLPPIGIAA